MPSTPEAEITEAYLITKRFHSSEEFSSYIQFISAKRDIQHLEALLEYCENNDVDTTAAAALIDGPLKAKIQIEAESLNLLKPTVKKGKSI